jgi:hypothetical protein
VQKRMALPVHCDLQSINFGCFLFLGVGCGGKQCIGTVQRWLHFEVNGVVGLNGKFWFAGLGSGLVMFFSKGALAMLSTLRRFGWDLIFRLVPLFSQIYSK